MKTNIFKQMRLWLPVMCATMMLAACSSDDSNADPKPGPSPEPEVKSIFYTATVGGDTRATVDGNNKTLKFAAGDKLYISSDARTDLKGYLTLTSGAGTTNEATFSGTLYYENTLPTSDIPVKATLVGAEAENIGLTISDNKVTGFTCGTGLVLPNGESSAVNEAVKKYSKLTGISTFGEKNFETLTQHTAFLNFTINVKTGGVNVGDTYNVTVANVTGGNRSGSVSITESGSDKVLKFAVPVAVPETPALTLDSVVVLLNGDRAVCFGTPKEITAKVYNVTRDVGVEYEYVDLGLSVKWAKTNLGAATETDYGHFYAWGGTTGYKSSNPPNDHTFDLDNAPFYKNSAYTLYTNANDVLCPSHDAATYARGAHWRIPTKTEFEELLSGTTVSIVWNKDITYKIDGYKFINKSDNTKYIYLPAAGRRVDNTIVYQDDVNYKCGNYWLSSRQNPSTPPIYYTGANAIAFSKQSYETPQVKDLDRYIGMTIRPVYVP